MSRFSILRGRPAVLLVLLALGACEAAGTLAGGGARSDYLVARQALETGNYDLAIRRYAQLVDSVDASSSGRLRLEYAHALLRGNRFDEAVAMADPLARRDDGAISASAMAVRGTARHETARLRLDAGQRDETTRSLLLAAQSDLTTALRRHDALDNTGSVQSRVQLIAVDLGRLS